MTYPILTVIGSALVVAIDDYGSGGTHCRLLAHVPAPEMSGVALRRDNEEEMDKKW